MDQEMRSRQVWQRVLNTPPEPQELKTLIYWAQEDAAAFTAVRDRTRGPQKEAAARLLEKANRTLSTLRGLEMLAGGRDSRPAPLPLPAEPVRRILEKAFRRSILSCREFTGRIGDQRFGTVFHSLAALQEENSAAIAALLGSGDIR